MRAVSRYHLPRWAALLTLAVSGAVLLSATAPAAAELDKKEQKLAKNMAKRIFEEFFRKPSDRLLDLYSPRVKLIRAHHDEDNQLVEKEVRPENVRSTLREWIYAEQQRSPKEVQYTLPSYAVEGDNVRVKTIRVEREPHTVTKLSLLVTEANGRWVIIEDRREKVTR